MKIIHGTGPRIRGYTPLEDFSTNTVQVPTVVGGSAGTQVVNEVTYTTQTGAGSVNLFRLDVSESNFKPGKSFASVTPSVCTVDSSGNVSHVADGLCKINVITPVGTRQFSQQLTTTGNTTVRTGVQSLAAGSLLKYLTDQRNALLAATTPGAARQRAYVNADGTGGLNPDNLLLRTDVAGWTSTPFSQILGARYLTAKHEIVTAHARGVGPYSKYWTNLDGSNVMAWSPQANVLQNGVAITPTTYGKVIGQDTAIVYYPAGNATTLTKLPPENLNRYLTVTGDYLVDVPVWYRRYNSSVAGESRWVQSASLYGLSNIRVPTDAAAKTFCDFGSTIQFTGGDSGTGMFLCINGEAILAYSLSFASGVGQSYATLLPTINTTMNQLSAQYVAAGGTDASNGSYAAQTANLSGFTLY